MNPPDYIQIPYQVVIDKNLQPSDRIVYGVIYWFEHLRDGRCTASNASIAEIGNIEIGSVQNALNRLESCGYISREFRDEKKRVRKEIHALISYKRVSSNNDTVSSNSDTRVSSNSEQKEKILNKKREGDRQSPSPSSFFKSFEAQQDLISSLVQKGMSQEKATHEVNKFVAYWTEPNKGGTKVRWESEKFFHLSRRLARWFGNVVEWEKDKKTSGGKIGLVL